METAPASSFFEKYGTPLAVLAGAIIIAGAFAFGRDGVPSAPSPATVDIKKVEMEGPSIGSQDAPVTIAVWADYQCPFCKRYELETVAQLNENYVKTGKLRIIFKDFQFLGPDSETAALFGRAVWDAYPERHYEWHTAMMENQDEGQGGFGDRASIEALTAGLGMDVARITSLIEDNEAEYLSAIEADRAEGASFGISGTPSTIIGKQVISGAQPYAQVSALIEAELK